MSFELIIFSTPLQINSSLTTDGGIIATGHPATHSTGRPGIGFTIPDNVPQGNGCKIKLGADKKVPIEQRARLIVRNGDDISDKFPWDSNEQTAALLTDDFILQDEKVCPEIPPEIPPITGDTPEEIIDSVHGTGQFNLATKEGCGKFTEACCTALHEDHSLMWGHIRKSGAQNQYNGHAVDAVMLLTKVGDTQAGVYDIIFNSESPDAEPQFIFKGPPDSNLWYYPV